MSETHITSLDRRVISSCGISIKPNKIIRAAVQQFGRTCCVRLNGHQLPSDCKCAYPCLNFDAPVEAQVVRYCAMQYYSEAHPLWSQWT